MESLDFNRQWLINKFDEIQRRLFKAVDQLKDEQINWKPDASNHSIAGLVSHIDGNIQERIILGIMKQEIIINRGNEFNVVYPNKEELKEVVSKGFLIIKNLLISLSEEELLKTQLVRNKERNHLDMLHQCAAHYSEHLGQIFYIAKLCLKATYQSTSIKTPLTFQIRAAIELDVPFLWEMLYESMYVPEGNEPFSRDIIHDPYLSKYVEGWGRDGDLGSIAVNSEGESMGSITARFFNSNNKGFGYVSDYIPELGMAIMPRFRGKGMGTALMQALFDQLKEKDIKQVSLSVDPGNLAAVTLYKRFGFKEVGMVDTSVTMVADI